MPRFRITFRKIVYDDTGHARAICQRTVELDARDRESAEAGAIAHFCDAENITDWLNHADWMETAPIGRMLARQSIRRDQARHAA